MMSTDPRKIGGDNNKRGNRYEDLFVIFHLLEYAPSVILDGCPVRLKEQAGCHVDDLLVVTPNLHRCHQLKADKAITWSANGNKLTKEFLAQKAACQQIGQACELVVVVAHPARAASLTTNMPAVLADCTTVLLFQNCHTLPSWFNGRTSERRWGRYMPVGVLATAITKKS